MTQAVAFASDHVGYALKESLKAALAATGGYEALDLGTDSEAAVDYPDFGAAAARAVQDGRARFAVIICGSGIGIGIAANRHAGIRAALCHNAELARLARQHNDANILAIGARFTPPEAAVEMLRVFLATPFEGGRHTARVQKLG